MRKRIIAASLALSAFAMLSLGTWAFFTTTDSATNVITVGDISIQVVETFDQEAANDIAPGESVTKEVAAENDGGNPAWVRIDLSIDAQSASGESLSTDPVILNFTSSDSSVTWEDGQDGWFYLSAPLESGDTSANIIDSVSLDSSAGNEYAGATINVEVALQAVQSTNNDTSGITATGWPSDGSES